MAAITAILDACCLAQYFNYTCTSQEKPLGFLLEETSGPGVILGPTGTKSMDKYVR